MRFNPAYGSPSPFDLSVFPARARNTGTLTELFPDVRLYFLIRPAQEGRKSGCGFD
jgi:hypothetical protein